MAALFTIYDKTLNILRETKIEAKEGYMLVGKSDTTAIGYTLLAE